MIYMAIDMTWKLLKSLYMKFVSPQSRNKLQQFVTIHKTAATAYKAFADWLQDVATRGIDLGSFPVPDADTTIDVASIMQQKFVQVAKVSIQHMVIRPLAVP